MVTIASERVLACPDCKASVDCCTTSEFLTCEACGRVFPRIGDNLYLGHTAPDHEEPRSSPYDAQGKTWLRWLPSTVLHGIYHGHLGYLLHAAYAGLRGSIYAREEAGLFDRPWYAYGLLRAATTARTFGVARVTACECGVGRGGGLRNLAALARIITKETGVAIELIGLDNGTGLPQPADYRDHPEQWSVGEYHGDMNMLRRELPDVRIIVGDLRDTVPALLPTLTAQAPLGFLALDADFYSSTMAALELLTGPSTAYLPAVAIYCDDVNMPTANRWCGELCAMDTFTAAQMYRKIDTDRTVRSEWRRLPLPWHDKMFVAHILDHPRRQPQR